MVTSSRRLSAAVLVRLTPHLRRLKVRRLRRVFGRRRSLGERVQPRCQSPHLFRMRGGEILCLGEVVVEIKQLPNDGFRSPPLSLAAGLGGRFIDGAAVAADDELPRAAADRPARGGDVEQNLFVRRMLGNTRPTTKVSGGSWRRLSCEGERLQEYSVRKAPRERRDAIGNFAA